MATRYNRLYTSEVKRATWQMMAAVENALKASGLPRDVAEGQLSSLMGTLWNELEAKVRLLPASRGTEKGFTEKMEDEPDESHGGLR
jgi:hypothetical protein